MTDELCGLNNGGIKEDDDVDAVSNNEEVLFCGIEITPTSEGSGKSGEIVEKDVGIIDKETSTDDW